LWKPGSARPSYGLYLTIPGFLFEVVMPFWLIFKGFQPEAYRGLPLHHRSFQEA